MKIVAVTGGRKYADEATVFRALNSVLSMHGDICIVEGGATGADRLSRYWCKVRKVTYYTEEAKWNDLSHKDAHIIKGVYGAYDAKAGGRRNQKIIDQYKPTLLVAFPGGRGTSDMITRAKKAGIEILSVK